MQVNIRTYPVEILTGHYQIGGEIEIRGNPAVFVNDASFSAFTIRNATLTPLTVGTSVGPVKVPVLFLPKSEPQVVLIGDFSPQDAQLLPTKIGLVCFTDSYVIRGVYHTGPETQPIDVFFSGGGPLFPATDAEIYPLRPMAADLGGQADLVYVHRDAIKAMYPF